MCASKIHIHSSLGVYIYTVPTHFVSKNCTIRSKIHLPSAPCPLAHALSSKGAATLQMQFRVVAAYEALKFKWQLTNSHVSHLYTDHEYTKSEKQMLQPAVRAQEVGYRIRSEKTAIHSGRGRHEQHQISAFEDTAWRRALTMLEHIHDGVYNSHSEQKSPTPG